MFLFSRYLLRVFQFKAMLITKFQNGIIIYVFVSHTSLCFRLQLAAIILIIHHVREFNGVNVFKTSRHKH